MPATGLGLDAWWNEPVYHAARVSFSSKGTFTLRKLSEHDKMVERYAHVREGRDAGGDAPDGGRAGGVGVSGTFPQATPRPITRAPRNA
jgi:hypothetical protein